MEVESKYNLNDQVWRIAQDMKQEYKPCKFCNGTGRIFCNGIDRGCPECYGRKGHMVNIELQWQVVGILTIGLIRQEIKSIKSTGVFDNIGEYDSANIQTKAEYMAYETGVGSGSVYCENRLFKDKESAQKQCDELNKAEKQKEIS